MTAHFDVFNKLMGFFTLNFIFSLIKSMNLHKYSQPPILYVDSHVYKIDLSQVKTSVFLEAFFFF